MAANQTPRAPTHADPQEAPSTGPEAIHGESREARLRRIRANLRLIDPPPAPSAAHDEGLRVLGLLNFIRLGLSSSSVPRPDLVAELIANYEPSPNPGWSSVRGQKIEISLDSIAEALRLPGKPPLSYSYPAGAVVTSAAKEFMKVYILAPIEASTNRKRRLPWMVDNALSSLEDLEVHAIDWAELIWERVKEGMEHLIEQNRTSRACYYGAYLQRLIWVEWQNFFQLPPEPPLVSAPPQPAALRPQKKRVRILFPVNESQKLGSKARSEKIDAGLEK